MECRFDPTYRFSTSWLLPPTALFAFRALLSLYSFTTIFTIFGWYGSHGLVEASHRSFSYFTNLTYWGLAFYFAFSAAHTASYWLTGAPLLARWPQVLQALHSIFYSTIIIFPWLVTSEYRMYPRILHRVTCISCFLGPSILWLRQQIHCMDQCLPARLKFCICLP